MITGEVGICRSLGLSNVLLLFLRMLFEFRLTQYSLFNAYKEQEFTQGLIVCTFLCNLTVRNLVQNEDSEHFHHGLFIPVRLTMSHFVLCLIFSVEVP